MYTSFINGSYTEPADDAASVELENPATLQHLGTAACASPKEVDTGPHWGLGLG